LNGLLEVNDLTNTLRFNCTQKIS